ncbi:MAG: Uncharacterised protein [Formosa sp. Hel3_A1_48]|nr:MAG: Uncharacterised protein [Formosa sp. Hel3_A1_48]
MESLKSHTAHRPWALPKSPWSYYQEWNDVVFLHYIVNEDLLRTLVPNQLELDKFDGNCWVSVVAFNMEEIHPRLLPSVDTVSNFHELNIRTYVKSNTKPGVYFLNIEASKALSCVLAQTISKLPYQFAEIQRKGYCFESRNTNANNFFSVAYTIGKIIPQKNKLESWLTERYALFQNYKKEIYGFEIHHKAWELHEITLKRLIIDYPKFNSIFLNPPDAMHYAKGVAVLSWRKTKEIYF